MKAFFHNAALMRFCLGIFIVVDGYPLSFFMKETLQLAPMSTNFTAGFLLLGILLMTPSTIIKKFYQPNVPVMGALMGFLGFCLLYAFLYNTVAIGDVNKDLIYYAFVVLFVFMLISIPDEISKQVVFVGVMFTLASNIGLVLSLLTDPEWTLGQRASIQYGPPGARSGNPHVFAHNAQIGLVLSLVWARRPKVNFLIKFFALSMVIFNIIILMLTFSKSAILSTTLTGLTYLFVNIRKVSPQRIIKAVTSPISLIILALPFVAFIGLIIVKPEIWEIITIYGEMIGGRFGENILALLGKDTAEGAEAQLDGSSANRVLSFTYMSYAVMGNFLQLIPGYGYKFFYLDVPILEALLCQGVAGFTVLMYAFYHITRESLRVVYRGGRNDIETFVAYLFLFHVVGYFTGGRPYDMAFLHPLCLFARFLGINYDPALSHGYVDQPPAQEPVLDEPMLQPT
ncbi:hypothetical protein J2I47_10295 [Fibrella sp. HMF5335]|uniref:Uncharacterized protein n=1 Tax=Fibrella rubiginis TaxID=2817060 RepID=A0A939GDF6_9BACT|nr:hypothetical protein [Fibrella rubiginis]MBO0936934.1 hypothetical protein [Fibrella rubiginis]